MGNVKLLTFSHVVPAVVSDQ